MQARTCLRFGAVSSMEVALRMLVDSSVSDLLRSTLRVALYASAMLGNQSVDGVVVESCGRRESCD